MASCKFPGSPFAVSLLFHVSTAVLLLTVKWEARTPAPPPLPARNVTIMLPPRQIRQSEPLPRAVVWKPPEQATAAVRRLFQPVLPRAEPARSLPTLLESAPALLEVVPPPVLMANPEMAAKMPAPPIKLGNLAEVSTVPGQPARILVAGVGAFGEGPVSERTAGVPALRASGFGAGEVVRPDLAEKSREVTRGTFGEVRAGQPAAVKVLSAPVAAATPVEILSKPRPEYTEEARKLRLEGAVVLEVRFTAEGRAEVVRVVTGLDHGLDEAAQRAAAAIKFRPARVAATPVDSLARVHIIFQLAY